MLVARLFLLLLPVLLGGFADGQAEVVVARNLSTTLEQLRTVVGLLSGELERLKARQEMSLESHRISSPPRKRRSTQAQNYIDKDGPKAETTGACPRDCLDGSPGLDGAPGLDGVPGVDGRHGRDGLDGKDGRDGKDGPPGSAGPPGPPGAVGEQGRRGRPGPPGRAGPPGEAGVCVYQSKYDCTSSPSGEKATNGTSLPRLLVAPLMVGANQQEVNEERQVSVNEGDNIQLSCEAFGSPAPIYVWRRSDKRLAIILDARADLKVSSYAGGQLPLAHIDRSQAGAYECLASNGVPPTASKRLQLDINYAPTVRLYLTSARSPLVQLNGVSLQIECLVEANPSALVYWMFENELLMSAAADGARPSTIAAKSRAKDRSDRLTISESAGQLLTGATYSILTLNLTHLEPGDLGEYKCVAKNLVGQTTGSILLNGGGEGGSAFKFQNGDMEPLDYTAGWPVHLIERDGALVRYATFGDEHRRRAKSAGDPFTRIELLGGGDGARNEKLPVGKQSESKDIEQTSPKEEEEEEEPEELCTIIKASSAHRQTSTSGASLQPLDQIGKPVFVGNGGQFARGSIAWWSRASSTLEVNGEPRPPPIVDERHFVTTTSQPARLFVYATLADLQRDLQVASPTAQPPAQSTIVELKYPISLPGVQVIHDGRFLYVTHQAHVFQTSSSTEAAERQIPRLAPAGSLDQLSLVVVELEEPHHMRLLPLESAILLSGPADANSDARRWQPLDLGPECKLNRIELAADEQGVWLLVPTLEPAKGRRKPRRRLHALKLNLTTGGGGGGGGERNNVIKLATAVEHHVSMKLDWRMLGQLFQIDAHLYGIKDKHAYASRLQFAFDLFKCKLLHLDTDEPVHNFTNHFGNTQLVKYSAAEPPRLYTIDSGNLLWRPVKLINGGAHGDELS